jgi:succinate dehydrogenase (or fumarate reductase) cytochrome b subunit, b558 family
MPIRFSNTFILRKLHQITGIVPLGVFYFVHIYTNSTAMSGARVFNEHVQDIHNMPYLLFIEILGIFVPLLYHSVYGIIISREARVNVGHYSYARNWFYLVQRISGVFLFFFLTFHILNFRFGMIPGLNLTPVAGHADLAFTIVSNEFHSDIIFFIYVLGVVATAWHLAYGIFLFAIDWGIVIGEKAQKVALYACIGFAVFLGAVGINAAAAFVHKCGLLPGALCEQAEQKEIVTPTRF